MPRVHGIGVHRRRRHRPPPFRSHTPNNPSSFERTPRQDDGGFESIQIESSSLAYDTVHGDGASSHDGAGRVIGVSSGGSAYHSHTSIPSKFATSATHDRRVVDRIEPHSKDDLEGIHFGNHSFSVSAVSITSANTDAHATVTTNSTYTTKPTISISSSGSTAKTDSAAASEIVSECIDQSGNSIELHSRRMRDESMTQERTPAINSTDDCGSKSKKYDGGNDSESQFHYEDDSVTTMGDEKSIDLLQEDGKETTKSSSQTNSDPIVSSPSNLGNESKQNSINENDHPVENNKENLLSPANRTGNTCTNFSRHPNSRNAVLSPISPATQVLDRLSNFGSQEGGAELRFHMLATAATSRLEARQQHEEEEEHSVQNRNEVGRQESNDKPQALYGCKISTLEKKRQRTLGHRQESEEREQICDGDNARYSSHADNRGSSVEEESVSNYGPKKYDQEGNADDEKKDKREDVNQLKQYFVNTNNSSVFAKKAGIEAPLVPFCRSCERTSSKLPHHGLCPKHPDFYNSGSYEILCIIIDGFGHNCTACMFHFENGRPNKSLEHATRCERRGKVHAKNKVVGNDGTSEKKEKTNKSQMGGILTDTSHASHSDCAKNCVRCPKVSNGEKTSKQHAPDCPRRGKSRNTNADVEAHLTSLDYGNNPLSEAAESGCKKCQCEFHTGEKEARCHDKHCPQKCNSPGARCSQKHSHSAEIDCEGFSDMHANQGKKENSGKSDTCRAEKKVSTEKGTRTGNSNFNQKKKKGGCSLRELQPLQYSSDEMLTRELGLAKNSASSYESNECWSVDKKKHNVQKGGITKKKGDGGKQRNRKCKDSDGKNSSKPAKKCRMLRELQYSSDEMLARQLGNYQSDDSDSDESMAHSARSGGWIANKTKHETQSRDQTSSSIDISQGSFVDNNHSLTPRDNACDYDAGDEDESDKTTSFRTKLSKTNEINTTCGKIHNNIVEDPPLSDYERLRLRNINRNEARLAQLGLLVSTSSSKQCKNNAALAVSGKMTSSLTSLLTATNPDHDKPSKRKTKQISQLTEKRTQPLRGAKSGFHFNNTKGSETKNVNEVKSKLDVCKDIECEQSKSESGRILSNEQEQKFIKVQSTPRKDPIVTELDHFNAKGLASLVDAAKSGCKKCTIEWQTEREDQKKGHDKCCPRRVFSVAHNNSSKNTPVSNQQNKRVGAEPCSKSTDMGRKSLNDVSGTQRDVPINLKETPKIPFGENQIIRSVTPSSNPPPLPSFVKEFTSSTNEEFPAPRGSKWLPCPNNPWGEVGHIDGDFVIISPFQSETANAMISAFHENQDGGLPTRFAENPLEDNSPYLVTHQSPGRGGYSVLQLKRDRLGLKPWGFTVRHHEFGGACLVDSVEPLSPAKGARDISGWANDASATGLRRHDMILCLNGKSVGGMTEFEFQIEMDLCGPEMLLVISRFNVPNCDGFSGQDCVLESLALDWNNIGSGTSRRVSFGIDTCRSQCIPTSNDELSEEVFRYEEKNVDCQEIHNLSDWGNTSRVKKDFEFETKRVDSQEQQTINQTALMIPPSQSMGTPNKDTKKIDGQRQMPKTKAGVKRKVKSRSDDEMKKKSSRQSLSSGHIEKRSESPSNQSRFRVHCQSQSVKPAALKKSTFRTSKAGLKRRRQPLAIEQYRRQLDELSDDSTIHENGENSRKGSFVNLLSASSMCRDDSSDPVTIGPNKESIVIKEAREKYDTNENQAQEKDGSAVKGKQISSNTAEYKKRKDGPRSNSQSKRDNHLSSNKKSTEKLSLAIANNKENIQSSNKHDKQRESENEDSSMYSDDYSDENPWLGCVCGKTHPRPIKVFWIQCESCEAWYNVAEGCIGFNSKAAEKLERWCCWACEPPIAGMEFLS